MTRNNLGILCYHQHCLKIIIAAVVLSKRLPSSQLYPADIGVSFSFALVLALSKKGSSGLAPRHFCPLLGQSDGLLIERKLE